MSTTRLQIEVMRVSDYKIFDTIIEIDSAINTLDDMYTAARAIFEEARKNVASRFVDYEAFNRDSAYHEALDAVMDDLGISMLAVEGEQKRYAVGGAYSRPLEGGQWADHVSAVNAAEATFAAQWIMLNNEGVEVTKITTEEGFEGFLDAMRNINIYDCYEEPVTRRELEDILASLLKTAMAAGIAGEAVTNAEETLQVIGHRSVD